MTRVEISKDPSGRIIASFPYAVVLVSKVKTTERRRCHPLEKFGIVKTYTHVSAKGIAKIKGPLDSSDMKEGGDK